MDDKESPPTKINLLNKPTDRLDTKRNIFCRGILWKKYPVWTISLIFLVAVVSIFLILECRIKPNKIPNPTVPNSMLLLNNLSAQESLSVDITDLRINTLTSARNFFQIHESKRLFVQNLTLSCALSDELIISIFKKLPDLKSLILHEDQLCRENRDNVYSINHNNSFPTIQLPKLETLVVNGARNICPFIQLILDRLRTPSLKHLTIVRSYVDLPFCKNFLSLLNSTQETVETIDISETYLYPQCEIMSIPYRKLRKLRISRLSDRNDINHFN